MVTLTDIEDAQNILEGRVLRTPMLPAPKLSELTGAEVFVKYENLQVTNSFKERGALNKLASLTGNRPGAGRDRDVGRQSRAGGGLSRCPPRHRRDHRHAGDDAIREDCGDPRAWRGGGAARRDRRRSAGARGGVAGRARADLHPSL